MTNEFGLALRARVDDAFGLKNHPFPPNLRLFGAEMGVNGCIIGCMLRSNTLQITPEILSLIARIDEFKGAWRALGTLAPERLLALRRVATIESIGSSTRIEGDLS